MKAKASAKESVEQLKDNHNMTADNRLFWSLGGEAAELSASSSGEEKDRRPTSHVSVKFSVEVSVTDPQEVEKEAEVHETERRFEILAKNLGLPQIGFDYEKKRTLLAQNEQLMNSLSPTMKEDKKEERTR